MAIDYEVYDLTHKGWFLREEVRVWLVENTPDFIFFVGNRWHDFPDGSAQWNEKVPTVRFTNDVDGLMFKLAWL